MTNKKDKKKKIYIKDLTLFSFKLEKEMKDQMINARKEHGIIWAEEVRKHIENVLLQTKTVNNWAKKSALPQERF